MIAVACGTSCCCRGVDRSAEVVRSRLVGEAETAMNKALQDLATVSLTSVLLPAPFVWFVCGLRLALLLGLLASRAKKHGPLDPKLTMHDLPAPRLAVWCTMPCNTSPGRLYANFCLTQPTPTDLPGHAAVCAYVF